MPNRHRPDNHDTCMIPSWASLRHQRSRRQSAYLSRRGGSHSAIIKNENETRIHDKLTTEIEIDGRDSTEYQHGRQQTVAVAVSRSESLVRA